MRPLRTPQHNGRDAPQKGGLWNALWHAILPPTRCPQTVASVKRALARLWVPDHLTHENPFVTLAAILGETRAHVGTSVTSPVCRTPVDLASSFSALAHLAGEIGITAGVGAGSSSSNMISLKKPRLPSPKPAAFSGRQPIRTAHASRAATVGAAA